MILILRIALGIVFTILGVIGSLLPIMQGWIFFLLAALVLFPQQQLRRQGLRQDRAGACRASWPGCAAGASASLRDRDAIRSDR